jgi:uncharacterized protein YukE
VDVVSEFHVDPASLDQAAQRFEDLSVRMQRALATLRSSLPNQNAMVGADEAGDKFADIYGPNSRDTRRAAAACVDGLASIAKGLAASAANYRDADDQSTIR